MSFYNYYIWALSSGLWRACAGRRGQFSSRRVSGNAGFQHPINIDLLPVWKGVCQERGSLTAPGDSPIVKKQINFKIKYLQADHMTPENKKSKRLMGVCLLGWVLLNYPILSLFDRPSLLFGIPVLFLYVFFSWACLIVLIYMGTRTRLRHTGRLVGREDPDA